MVEVYRFIKEEPSLENIRQHFAITLGFFKTMIALDVLKELNLTAEFSDGGIQKYRNTNGVRADLSQSKILEFLKG